VDAPLGALAPTLLLLAGLAVALVVITVRFSAAMVTPRRRGDDDALRPEGWSRVEVLAAVYLLVWTAILATLMHLLSLLGEDPGGPYLALLLGAAAAWLAGNALWIALARALLRAPSRALPREGEEPAAESPPIDHSTPPLPHPVAPPGKPWWKRALQRAAALAAVLGVIAAGEAIEPLRDLTAHLAAHERRFLIPTASLAVIGFVVFMGAVIDLVLRGGPSGNAGGKAAGETVRLRDLKAALRTGAWRTSRRWRRILLLAAGAVTMSLGLMGTGIVLAPAGVKLLLAAALLYAALRTAHALARA